MNRKGKSILLTGFRATGKTAVGLILAQKMDYHFIDSDVAVCEQAGASVAEIVRRSGWDGFRKFECRFLEEFAGTRGAVLATGGGAIQHQREWERLRESCLVVWLEADAETIYTRMHGDEKSSGQRPALTGRPPEEEIKELLEKRTPLYMAGSDLRLDTVGHTPEQLAVEIVQWMEGTAQ